MRITGGVLCGRRISVPDGIIRPAMDRMRESLFSIIGDLTGASFLDLFSGSGIIALEAASRGATEIDAVEADHLKRSTLINNCSISPVRIECHFISVELYIRRARRSWDYVFCDPPFPYRFKAELLRSIVASALIAPPTLLMIHRPKEDKLPEKIPPLCLADQRIYGRSIVNFYRSDEN